MTRQTTESMRLARGLRGRAAGASAFMLLGASLFAVPVAAQDYPTSPPAPAPLEPAKFPPFREARLANGLELVVVESDDQPVLSVSLSMPAGSAYDPAGKEGLADMVAALLTKGAGERSAEQIAATIEGVGGSLSASAGVDFLTVGANVLAPNAALAFELVSDAILRPTFPTAEVELARTQTLSALQLQLSQPASLASRFFDQDLYGTHPYARNATPPTVRAITRGDLVAFQEARLRPGGALLVVAGDITLADAQRLAEASFGRWSGTAPAAAPFPSAPARAATEILLVHRPGSVQSNIVVGNTTFGPADQRRYAATVANKVLGGGADSRLFMILREQNSWTYGAYSNLSRPLGTGAFRASTEVRTEVTDSAVAEVLTQLRRIGTEPVPAAELEAAKGALVGSFPLTIETAQQIAGAVSQARRLGLGDDYLQQYRSRLAAISTADLRTAARGAIRPDSALIVVVGDGAKIYEGLARIAPVRIIDPRGDVLQPGDLVVKASAVALDPRRLVVGSDSFAITVQGNTLGFQRTTVAKTADGYTISEASEIGPAVSATTTITLSDQLEMRSVLHAGKVQGNPSSIDVTYADGRATGSAAMPAPPTGAIKAVTVAADVPAGAIDDHALGALLPTLPWAADAKFSLPVFSSGQGELRQMAFAVTGTEAVTVPAGTFQVFRVEVTGGPQPTTYYIEQAAPHRVVKAALVGTPVEIVRVR